LKRFDDFTTTLAEEALADMADAFFGSRKKLEGMMTVFREFVEQVRESAEGVDAQAALIRKLMLDREPAERFYRELGVASPEPLLDVDPEQAAVPPSLPSAWTRKGRYAGLVRRSYAALHERWETYLNGPKEQSRDPDGSDAIAPSYHLVLKMGELINERVEQTNRDMAPTWMLQQFRGFDPAKAEKARISGTDGFGDGMDRKLAFRPIDLDALDLKTYPELPDPAAVSSEITDFCRKHYSDRKAEVEAAVSEIRRRMD